MFLTIFLICLAQVNSAADWSELDELSYYTKTDLEFKPSDQDILLRYGEIFERKIYTEPVELTEVETIQIENFRSFLIETGQKLPDRFINDPARYELRYLTASQFNFQKAYDRLVMRDKWISETLPFPREKGVENPYHKSGSYYWMGRDLQCRPVAVVNMKNYIKIRDQPISDVLAYAFFFYQYGIENFMVPGRVESFQVIYDLAGVQPWQLGRSTLELVKVVMVALGENFATRGQFAFVVNMPFLVRQAYNIAWYFIPEFTRNNVIDLTEKQLKEGKMLEYIHADVLEQKYGGNKPNIVNYFPPDFSVSREPLLTKKQVLEYKGRQQEKHEDL